MDRKWLGPLNRGIRKYVHEREITVIIGGLSVKTEFHKVTALESDVVDFTLISDDGGIIGLSYSYETGKLSETAGLSEVLIDELFSNRHLRSVLFYVWDFRFLHEKAGSIDELNGELHSRFPVPVLKTSLKSFTGNEKKWFKVDTAEIQGNDIHLTGILSITDRRYFAQPVIASCVCNFRKGSYKWSFKVAGTKVNRDTEEYFEPGSVGWDDLFRITAEMDIRHYCLTADGRNPYSELTIPILRMLKCFEFTVFTDREGGLEGMQILSFIIKRILEVTDSEIVFEICDMEQPSSLLVCDRTYHGLYLRKKKKYSRNKSEFEFTHNAYGNTDKFLKVLKIIEKQYPKN